MTLFIKYFFIKSINMSQTVLVIVVALYMLNDNKIKNGIPLRYC